jgi:hypothetical protein
LLFLNIGLKLAVRLKPAFVAPLLTCAVPRYGEVVPRMSRELLNLCSFAPILSLVSAVEILFIGEDRTFFAGSKWSRVSILTGAIRYVALKAVLNREIWYSPYARKPNPVFLGKFKDLYLAHLVQDQIHI